MTVSAEKVGRNLHLKMEGVEQPFVIKPLPGGAGIQITDVYLRTSSGKSRAEEWSEALVMAVDGAVFNEDTGIWEPVPDEDRTNFHRFDMELSQAESEGIIMPAYFWQTVLGMDGVRAYLEGGEGLAGTLKAAGALTSRMGLLARKTSLPTE